MYYRLTHITGPRTSKSGHGLLGSDKPVLIGQLPDCDVLLPVSDIYQPQVFAAILPREDKSGWMIVRRTDHFGITINDKPLHTAAPLKDFAVIAFDNGSCVTKFGFKIFKNGDLDEMGRVSHSRAFVVRRAVIRLTILLLLATLLFLPRLSHDGRQLKKEDLGQYEASLFRIAVDSIYLTMDTLVDGQWQETLLAADELASPHVGTCFLTKKGYFVTARHCLEPWLDDEAWDGSTLNSQTPIEILFAAQAETRNRAERTGRYHVKSRCIISNEQEHYELYSSEFGMNKSRDQVLRLGSDRNPIYWRTITPLASRRDMELGDFAYAKAPAGIAGSLEAATMADMLRFKTQGDKDIAVLGFPISDHGVPSHMTIVYGNCQQFDFDSVDDTRRGCMMMTAPVNRGNSGGPVLAHIGKRVMVIGIVSKADAQASLETFWAVPITEVEQSREKVKKGEADTLIYRR
ncbi:MAG: trypsin-like peptidase domain-containing protein [Bacteroidales bacterium]|nr:trypsin-like peptidase domain-containing protein [Bacteroidales bacterium]